MAGETKEELKMDEQRLAKVQRVTIWTLAMNTMVCLVKITLGLSTGVMAITADGFHSLGDSLSNTVMFVGIRLARRKPDRKHGYGYERYEAITTLLIVSLISITCYKVFETGIERLMSPKVVEINPLMLVIMVVSMAVNVITVIYEGGAGRRLKSQLLIADSKETKSDLWVSGGVIATTFIVSRTGWFWLDGVVTIAIGFLIIRVIVEIVKPTARQLADAQVVEPERVRDIAMSVPGVRFCHAIRSHGQEDGFFLDCHLGVDTEISVREAHEVVCHAFKLALYEAFPGLKSALVHIEPNSGPGVNRGDSVFRDRDPYDYGTSGGQENGRP